MVLSKQCAQGAGIFPLASGPGLIQMTAGDKLTLGGDLVRAIVMLNQNITSFNATLGKVESFRVAHAAALSRVHVEATRRLMARGDDATLPTFETLVAESPMDANDVHLTSALINLLIGLHAGLIGCPGSNGLCASYHATRAAYERDSI